MGTRNTQVHGITSKLYLINYDTGVILAQEEINGAWSVDVTLSLGSEPIVFLADGNAGVKSFQVDVPTSRLVFECQYNPPQTIVARDVVFDEISFDKYSKKILYAACYRDGMYAFDVSQSGSNRLDHLNTLDWNPAVIRDRALDGLDIYQKNSSSPIYLCIGAGANYAGELQWFGADDFPNIGKEYGSTTPTKDAALLIYDITDVPTSNPVYKDKYEGKYCHYAVSVGTSFDLPRAYTACDSKGLQAFRIDWGGTPPIEYIGGYFQNQDVPLGSVDHVIYVGDYIYTVSETALQTYWLLNPEGALYDLKDFDFPAGVFLRNLQDYLYSSAHTMVHIYNISAPNDPLEEQTKVKGSGRRHGCYPILVNVLGVDKKHLYVSYGSGYPDPETGTGALGIWDVTDLSSKPKRLGNYYCTDPTGVGSGKYIDTVVKEVSGNRYAYVSFRESRQVNVGAGLHCFKITSTPPTESIELVDTDAITTNPSRGTGAHLMFSEGLDRVYGAFGWGGLGVFDVMTNPANPSLIGKRLLYGSALHARPITVSGRIYAVVSLLTGYIAVLDVTDAHSIVNSEIYYYRTPFQANVTQQDPVQPTDPRYMVLADGRGGVRRVMINSLP